MFRIDGIRNRGPWYFGGVVDARGPGTGMAVFDSDGVLRRRTVTAPVTVDGRNATLRHRYRTSFESSTVTQPEWFDRALRTATATPCHTSRTTSSSARRPYLGVWTVKSTCWTAGASRPT